MESKNGGYEMKVLAKDAKAGQWYESISGFRLLCIKGSRVANDGGEIVFLGSGVELTHLPDCTGWDWQPPKPEKRYRAFSGVHEFLCHLEARCPHDWFFRRKVDAASQHCSIIGFSEEQFNGQSWQSAFDDLVWSKDGSPFGVEVTE